MNKADLVCAQAILSQAHPRPVCNKLTLYPNDIFCDDPNDLTDSYHGVNQTHNADAQVHVTHGYPIGG